MILIGGISRPVMPSLPLWLSPNARFVLKPKRDMRSHPGPRGWRERAQFARMSLQVNDPRSWLPEDVGTKHGGALPDSAQPAATPHGPRLYRGRLIASTS